MARRLTQLGRRVVGPILLSAAALALAACDAGGAPEPACTALRRGDVPDDANLVLIVSDTMRRDRMSIHGGSAHTPRFDRFADEHLFFENASTEASWTRPAIATLFTSLYPSQHRLGFALSVSMEGVRPGLRAVTGGRLDVMSQGFETLAEVLQESGFRTAAFVTNIWLQKGFGLEQGFEQYDDMIEGWGHHGEEVSRRAAEWIESRPEGERFFLYLHYMESHRPYGKPTAEELLAERARIESDARPVPTEAKLLIMQQLELADGRPLIATGLRPTLSLLDHAYDRGVENFDRVLGLFLDALRAHPAHERTAVIITADHGEALYARGFGNHGRALYADEKAIPLVARLPGVEPSPARIDCAVGLIDVLPTICAYLGIPCPGEAEGVSFVRTRSEPPPPPRYLVSEGIVGKPTHRSVRNRRYKLVYQPEGTPVGAPPDPDEPFELFDTESDPTESRNLLAEAGFANTARWIARRMSRGLPEAVPEYEARARRYRSLSEETTERLRALGYAE